MELILTAFISGLITLLMIVILLLLIVLFRRQKNQQACTYIYKKIFSDFRPAVWHQTRVSYYHSLKAARVLLKCNQLLRSIGYTEAEFLIIYPLLLHLEACVYCGDLEYESQQNKGFSFTVTTWKKNIETMLNSYELYDEKIEGELDNLEKYFVQESEIILKQVEIIDESLLLNLFYIRSSDIYMLLRLVYKLKDIPYNESFFKLFKPWLVLEEIRDDLQSYEKDVAENSFNTLRLYVQLYGKEQAANKLREMRLRLIHNGLDSLASLDKLTITQFCTIALEDLGIPFMLTNILNLVPRFLLVYCVKLLFNTNDNYYGIIPQAIDEPTKKVLC